MTENKTFENTFKFGLYQENDMIIETSFTADNINPAIRYSVDIRDEVFSIISRLQKALSRRNLTHKIDLAGNTYDFLEHYRNQSALETKSFNDKLDAPKKTTHKVNGKIYSGVQFKFGLFINNNLIVERDFYVKGYNPASRFSLELSETVNQIADEINESLREDDIKHMWDDYDLIHTYNLYINDIRDLSQNRRNLMLKKINDRDFVKKYRPQ